MSFAVEISKFEHVVPTGLLDIASHTTDALHNNPLKTIGM